MAKLTREHASVEERFWARVNKNGPVRREGLTPCWVWTGATLKGGYGNLRVRGRSMQAHRFAWELTHGQEPDGFVLHHCDNPACVRPEHLFLGDQTANMRDCAAKGRTAKQFGGEHWTRRRPEDVVRGEAHPWSTGDHARGEANTKAKLTADDVRVIREAVPSYGYAVRLARQFGVGASTIRAVRRGETWSHV